MQKSALLSLQVTGLYYSLLFLFHQPIAHLLPLYNKQYYNEHSNAVLCKSFRQVWGKKVVTFIN